MSAGLSPAVDRPGFPGGKGTAAGAGLAGKEGDQDGEEGCETEADEARHDEADHTAHPDWPQLQAWEAHSDGLQAGKGRPDGLQAGKGRPDGLQAGKGRSDGLQAERVEETLMPPAPAIETLAIVFTADCNLRCRYCYQDRKRPVQISWQAVSAALDLLERSRRRCERLSFFGGEPLLAFPMIARTVRRVDRRLPRRRRPEFFLTTNGLLLTPRRLAFLERHRFKVQLSFDGVAPAQDLRFPGSFAVLDRLLDRLSLRHRAYFRRRVTVAVTLTAPSIPHLADSFDYLVSKGVEDIAIGPAMGHPRLSKAQAGELERQFGRVFSQSLRHYRATGAVPLSLFRKRAPDARTPDADEWACSAPPGRNLTVDVDGRVYPCALLIRSCQRVARPALARRLAAMGLGSITNTQTLVERQGAVQAEAGRAGIFGPQRLKGSSLARCATCRHAGVCFICPIAGAKNPDSADANRIPDFQCAFNRIVFDYRRRFPVQD